MQLSYRAYEVMGYVALALTIAGQVVVNMSPLAGQSIWMGANVLYIAKAAGQRLGRAEMARNIVLTVITLTLMVLCAIGVL